jgi:flagellin
MINSINTNIAAYYAQANIGIASSLAARSVAALSSGNRIVQAAQDVAALSIGTGLRTAVSALRTALTNASQGTSLLQVADGALSQITEILQRQRAIAFQAGSGTLRDEDRTFLQQEFSALTAEANRLARSTNFNGVKLLDGTLSDAVRAIANSANAASASMSISFSANNTGVQTLIINGITLTGGTEFTVSATNAQDTLNSLVTYLNNINNSTTATAAAKAALGGMIYSRDGDALVIRSRTGGTIPQNFTMTTGAAGTWATAAGTINGQGGQTTATLSAFSAGNIDTDVSATGTGVVFANGVITYDGTTIATVANGDTLRSIMNKINALTGTTGVRAIITGASGNYNLSVISNDIADAGVLAGAAVTGGTGLTVDAPVDNAVEYAFGGGTNGLGFGSVIGTGTTGSSSLITDQLQNFARSILSYGTVALTALTNATITIEGAIFTFTSNGATSRSQSEITIGATMEETLDNAVAAINGYNGLATQNYALSQIEVSRNGTDLIIRGRVPGDILDIAGSTVDIAASVGTVSNANLSSPTNTGIDTRGVMNAAFVGRIQGFSSTYVSANLVDLEVTVGNVVYRAKSVATNPTAATDVRFISEDGGYFVVNTRANAGMAVANNADAATYGLRMDAAFSGVTFSQTRTLSSYNPTGDLLGSSVRMQLSDFGGVQIQGITVAAPSGSNPNGMISFLINGELYTAQVALGEQLGANSITRFVSASDVNKYIEFRNGSTALAFDTEANAKTLQTALKNAFGVVAGASALNFQIGTSADDTLAVTISNATSANLFDGLTLSVSTQLDASLAAAVLDTALNKVTSIRAEVGAKQSSFNFASANIQITIQNQDAARGELLDTDVASESTNYATAQVKLQAGISVLAQANQQLQALLKLIG